MLGAMKVDTSTFGCRFLSATLVSPLKTPVAQNHAHFFGNQNEIFPFTAAHIIHVIFKNSTQCCVIVVVYLVIQRSPAINSKIGPGGRLIAEMWYFYFHI